MSFFIIVACLDVLQQLEDLIRKLVLQQEEILLSEANLIVFNVEVVLEIALLVAIYILQC